MYYIDHSNIILLSLFSQTEHITLKTGIPGQRNGWLKYLKSGKDITTRKRDTILIRVLDWT